MSFSHASVRRADVEVNMKVTIADVAKVCGVSKTLVSRVVNKDSKLKIPDSTRNNILDEVDKLGYIPDPNAKLLASKAQIKKANEQITIGCITYTSYNKLGHPYFSHIMEGVLDEVDKNDCKLVTTMTIRELNELINRRQTESLPKMDGLIMFGWSENMILRETLEQCAKYVVCLNELMDTDADFVGSDINKTLLLSLDHLVKLGYSDIGMIIAQHNDYFRTCHEFLRGKGMEFNKDWIIQGEYSSDVAYSEVNKLLCNKKPPRAIFAWNDEMALGCMKALINHGYKIPEDVAIVGHDDINMAAYAEVPLTTVRIYKEEIGHLAVRTLLDRIKSRRKIAIRVEIPGKLIVRDSCGAKMRPAKNAKAN